MGKNKKKAIVLLSGGMDSAVCLYVAKKAGFECHALSIFYGQRHECELKCATQIANEAGVTKHILLPVDLTSWGGSALTDVTAKMPNAVSDGAIPSTYVPARNLIFLSLATAWGEVIDARDIFIGVNNIDYSGYPDCRPAFIEAFSSAAKLGTRAADENWRFNIHTPLQHLSKAQIITLGRELEVNFALTTSCYDPDSSGRSCGVCPSCLLRQKGFADAKIPDPTRYSDD